MPCINTSEWTLFRENHCNNIKRHTVHAIAAWPNPSSYFRFDDDYKTKYINILSIIKKEMGKLKTHSPTYRIMDNWENMLNLTHTLDKLYRTGIFIGSMSSDKVCTMMIMRWCNVQTKKHDLHLWLIQESPLQWQVNSLPLKRCSCIFRYVIFKHFGLIDV